MAGQKKGVFKELISPFLDTKIQEAEKKFGAGSPQHLALTLQYMADSREDHIEPGRERRRHYEAELFQDASGETLKGVERLYRRTALIEPSTVCAANCRWCLRGQYPTFTMSTDQIIRAAKYFGSPAVRDDLQEILITGGDPFMVRVLLEYTIDQIVAHAPNIEIIRIGTRIPTQNPGRVDDALLAVLTKYRHVRIEVGTHINHPIEFWPESVEAFRRLTDKGVRIYNQHPLLNGVNDDLPVLYELYDLMRHHAIEAHYLFHCIPMRGMQHHRTTVAKGLELIQRLVSSGKFSGRAKPQYFAMTDIGKVPFYEGAVVARKGNDLLLQSGYRLEERLKWNPTWQMPEAAQVDEHGYLCVWYPDGPGDQETEGQAGGGTQNAGRSPEFPVPVEFVRRK
jgi:lysine 2,3-aminomutase